MLWALEPRTVSPPPPHAVPSGVVLSWSLVLVAARAALSLGWKAWLLSTAWAVLAVFAARVGANQALKPTQGVLVVSQVVLPRGVVCCGGVATACLRGLAWPLCP